jgi:hypothetical protein
MRQPVLAAHRWPNNAALIRDVARLRYLRKDWVTLDPTYGRGNWWKLWRPDTLICHDLYNLDGIDFRQLPEPDECFDAIAYDPPYVSVGGRKTTSMPGMHDAYGLTAAPRTPAELQTMIDDGLKEMMRVLKPGGVCLVKCQDYVSSGKLWIGTHHTLTHALDVGFRCVDRFEHIGTPRPQPKRKRADGERVRQHHARRNLSTLFVLERPKQRRTRIVDTWAPSEGEPERTTSSRRSTKSLTTTTKRKIRVRHKTS